MAEGPPQRPVLPSETERHVTLREFEQRLYSLQMQMVDNIKAHRELADFRANALEKALLLQATEYERRLSVLNHAHEQAVREQARVVPREMFDQFGSEWTKWRDEVNVRLSTITNLTERMGTNEARVRALESTSQNAAGALTLVRFMGMAGVLALLGLIGRLASGGGW